MPEIYPSNTDIDHRSQSNAFLEKNISKGPKFGKRFTQMILLMICTFIVSSIKGYMSVCVLAMTDPYASSSRAVPTYNWTDNNLILSSFFWGYCIPQIFSGWLTSTWLGPKWILIFSISSSSIIGFLIPSIASAFGSKGVLACRFLQGFCTGFQGTSLYAISGKWMPPTERSRSMGYVYSGSTVGIILSMFLSGQIAASDYGWPSVIYLYSASGILWSIAFGTFGCNSPDDHLEITVEEKMYIQADQTCQNDKEKLITPWKMILLSPCVWSLIIAQCGESYAYYLLLTEMSNYFKNILKIDIKTNGMVSALPYILTLIALFLSGYLADFVIKKKICTIGGTRKILTAVGFIVPGVCFIFLGYYGAQYIKLAVVLSIIGIGVDYAANLNGILVNYLDLAPNHSGALMGIANQFAQPFSALAPLTVHFIMSDATNVEQWRTVFNITIIFKALTGTAFLLFGSGEVQPWNNQIQKTLEHQLNEHEMLKNT